MKKIRKYLHQSECETLAKRLAAYSAAITGAVALAPEAYAGVGFTPQANATLYQTGHNNANGLDAGFDLNNDGINDVSIYIHTAKSTLTGTPYYGAVVAIVPYGNALAGDFYASSNPTPYAVNLGDTIGKKGMHFTTSPYGTSKNQQTLGVFEKTMGSSATTVSIGNWISENSKFLGVQFAESNGNLHYGWLKMTTHVVSDTASVTFLEGYAFESVINKPIIAGDTGTAVIPWPADTASNIVGHDVGNNNNGSDLEVTFNMANDESTIKEYRILVVEGTKAATFKLDSAQAVVAANYTKVLPAGINIIKYLSSSANDAEGNPIQNGVPYRIFILNVADGKNATFNSLSGPSLTVTLKNTVIVAADTATNIKGTQVATHNNGTDLQVTFNKAANESTIGSYRILVVEQSKAASFDITAANNVISTNYTYQGKTGSNLSKTLSVSSNDAEGNPIADGNTYVIFVLDVADGTTATVNSLSGPSAAVALQAASTASAATNILATDIANHDNGLDLQVSFTKAANENTVSAYRIIVVKTTEAAVFNLDSANKVVAANYTSVTKTGGNIVQPLTATSNDADGNLIHDSVAYQVFVLNVADGTNATINSLSGPSASITLLLTGISSVNQLENVDMYSYASDIYLHFHSANQSNAVLQVYNTLGQQVYSKEVNGDQKIRLNTAEGIYAVSLTQNGKVLRKLVYISAQ